MPRYRVLRDFGSHLGNHYQGEQLNLPEGDLPRGFAGLVERVEPPPSPVTETKDVVPASGRTNDAPSDAGAPAPNAGTSLPAESAPDAVPSDAADDPPEPEERPTPADQARAGYADKMLATARNSGHGHVRPRPDGVKARCGGPGICTACSKEQAALKPRRST